MSKTKFIILILGVCILAACAPSPQAIQTVLALTQAVYPTSTFTFIPPTETPTNTLALTETQVFTKTEPLTPTPSFPPTITSTETPAAPVSLVFQGVSLSCSTSGNCICIVDPIFTVRLTVDPQGNVTGIFERYVDSTPDIILGGTVSNIIGSAGTKGSADSIDFIGYLNNNFSRLYATIYFRDPNCPGKRELYFMPK